MDTKIKQAVVEAFNRAFTRYFSNELVTGKLAHLEFKDNISQGDTVDITMPRSVRLFDYDGGDLPSAEPATISTYKLKIDRGKAFHFELLPTEKKILEKFYHNPYIVDDLLKDYTRDTIKQFGAAVDASFANLFTRAGHYLDDSGKAITLTPEIAKDIFAYMQAKFQRGDGKGHTNWIDGSMICIIPPEYQFYLWGIDNKIKNTKGYIGTLCGWDILVSSNIAQPEDGVFYPLFGVKGKTLAGGISSALNTIFYTPEKTFNTCCKGYGLYGVGAAHNDYLGTVKVKAKFSL